MTLAHLTDPLPPWLMSAWRRLHAARSADRLPHALLIAGPRGLGKRVLVAHLARALLCQSPGLDGEGCTQCADCRLFEAGNHPDLLQVGPDPEAKSLDIPIAAIRALCEREVLTPSRAARKVVLIDPADRLNTAAANALLKTLEEPPGHSLLCLIAEHPARLPATIRSRCQQLRLAPPPEAEALAWLDQQGLDGEEASVRLRLARGAPFAARDALDAERLRARADCLEGLVALACGERDPLREADNWNRLGVALTLEWLAAWLCDLLRLGVASDPPWLDNPDRREALVALARGLDLEAGHRLLSRVLEARALAETTVNGQMLLESLLIDWMRLVRHT